MTREEWLEAAIRDLTLLFPKATVFPKIKISVGWPKGASDRKTFGQCFDRVVCLDRETYHIFVSPKVFETTEALRVTLHELVHAVVGVDAHHRGTFAKTAASVGLMKPWTSTPASDALLVQLNEIGKRLGAYPHVGLEPSVKKQSTRMKLWECQLCKPPVKVRRAGEFHAMCLVCNTEFVKQDE